MGLEVVGALIAMFFHGAAPAAASPSFAGEYENERLGFELRYPRGWTPIPVKLDEKWIVAKFLSDREYPFTHEPSGWTGSERAEMWVICLADPADPADERHAAHASYAEYMKSTYKRAGYYIEAQKTVAGAEIPTTAFDLRVKSVGYVGPKRITTWVYDRDGVRLAVQFEVPESGHDKLRREVGRCLASFKAIPRVAAAEPEGADGVAGSEPVSPEDRRRRAVEREKELHERALGSLPEGWTSERSERLLVVSHASERRAERFVEQAEAVLTWLDDTFPYVGPENYVRAPILRVCKDYDELASTRKGSSDTTWAGADIEILCCAADTTSGQYDVVNQRVMEIWFRERDARLYASFPRWVSSGLRDMLADSRQKRGKIEFKEDDSDRADLREAIRADTLATPAELMQMGAEQFGDDATAYEESGVFVEFLISKDAARSELTKDLLRRYVQNLNAVLAEIESEERAAKGEGDDEEEQPRTEEEEDALFRQRQERWKERERRILDETYERTFRSWSEKDWKRLERAFQRRL